MPDVPPIDEEWLHMEDCAVCYANHLRYRLTQKPGIKMQWMLMANDIVNGSSVPIFDHADDTIQKIAQLAVLANVCGFVDVVDPSLDPEKVAALRAGLEEVYNEIANEAKETIAEANANLEAYIKDPRYEGHWRFTVPELLLLHFSGATETALRVYKERRAFCEGYGHRALEENTKEGSAKFLRMINKCRMKTIREEADRDNEELKRLEEELERAKKKAKHSTQRVQEVEEKDAILAAGSDEIPVRLVCNKGEHSGKPIYGFFDPSDNTVTTHDGFDGLPFEGSLTQFIYEYHTSKKWKEHIQVLPSGELLADRIKK